MQVRAKARNVINVTLTSHVLTFWEVLTYWFNMLCNTLVFCNMHPVHNLIPLGVLHFMLYYVHARRESLPAKDTWLEVVPRVWPYNWRLFIIIALLLFPLGE